MARRGLDEIFDRLEKRVKFLATEKDHLTFQKNLKSSSKIQECNQQIVRLKNSEITSVPQIQ